MKTSITVLPVLLAALLLSSCGLAIGGKNVVRPSNNIITETRDVSGITGIDFKTFGQVIITQGDTESLTIKASDNVLPLVKTTVSGGTLTIETDQGISLTGLNEQNTPVYAIVVKDLTSLNMSGAGVVNMDSLTTSSLSVDMSGAGSLQLGTLTAGSVNINISGVGGVNVAGEVKTASIDISGAGPVNAPDLKVQTADVNISGLGSATIWVTDQLNGDISGAGSISYYGSPQTSTTNSGLGSFKSLGAK